MLRTAFAVIWVLVIISATQSLVYPKIAVPMSLKMFLTIASAVLGLAALINAKQARRASLIGVIGPESTSRAWTLAVGTAAIVGLALRLSLLTDSFYEDEFQHLGTAVGYLKYGRFYRWDFYDQVLTTPYKRAWPFTWQVAQSFRLFGVSPFSGRLVSLVWGMALIFLAYYLGKTLTHDRWVGLTLAWLTAISPTFISMSTYMRMYAMFVVVFTLFAYLFMKAIEGNGSIGPAQGISLPYLLAAALVFTLSFFVHVITLIAVVGIAIYLLACTVLEYRRGRSPALNKYSAALAVLALLGAAALAGAYWRPFPGLRLISLVYNLDYFKKVVLPVPSMIGLPLLTLGLAASLSNRKTAYFSALLTGGLIFFAFVGNRYVSAYYISNIVLFAYLLMVVGLAQVKHLLDGKFYKLAVSAVVILTMLNAYMLIDYRRVEIMSTMPRYDRLYSYLETHVAKGAKIWVVFPRNYYLARHPGLRVADIRNISKHEPIAPEDINKVLAGSRDLYVIWPVKKESHLAPDVLALIKKKMKPLFKQPVRYGFMAYLYEPGRRRPSD